MEYLNLNVDEKELRGKLESAGLILMRVKLLFNGEHVIFLVLYCDENNAGATNRFGLQEKSIGVIVSDQRKQYRKQVQSVEKCLSI